VQTPYFLYHWELGSSPAERDGQLVKLNPYEVAARLSYSLWATMPDDALFAAADANQLSSPDQIAQQARRLLDDPRAKDALRLFAYQWLEIADLPGLEKDPSLAGYSPTLLQSMQDETGEFLSRSLLGPKAAGDLETLFTSTASFANSELAKLYGLTGSSGPGMAPLPFDGGQRAGLLTQASFLSSHADATSSHPVKRGLAVLRRLLCVDIPLPANLVVPPLPEPLPGQTTRERFDIHGQNPCASCHRMIDPVGFAFEHFDALGAFRSTEVNKPVDSTGTFDLNGRTIKFTDAVDLTKQLVGADEIEQCMPRQWLRYVLGRREGEGEASSLRSALQAFSGSKHDVRQMIVALTASKAFTHRTPAQGEVLQ
jgi:hypothetical protein